MSKINYELEIIGEKKIYHPRKEFIDPIVTSKKKIFEITSDNSYGKTFILNLIAYALEVDKLSDDKILKTIKERIKGYDDLSSYNLEYDIILDLPDNKTLSLSKAKGRNKLIQIDDSPPIGYNVLHKNLSVIYDVPTNPSDRLNAVIKDLDSWNNRLQDKIIKTLRYFNDISKEFDSVRNEYKIKKLEESSLKINSEIKVLKINIQEKKTTLNDLLQIKNLNNLKLLYNRKADTETKIFKITKQFKALKKPAKIEQKDEAKIKLLHTEAADVNRNFKVIISKLIEEIEGDIEISELILEKNDKHYSLIKETELNDIYKSVNYVTKQKKFIDSVDYVKDTIIRFIQGKKNDKSYVIHNSYKQFIEILKELMENEIDYLLKPATSVDSSKLITHLESIINEHKIKDFDTLRLFLNSDLKSIKGLVAQFLRVQNKLKIELKKKLVKDDDSKYYEIQGQLQDLKEFLKKVNYSIEKSRVICANDAEIDDLERFDSLDKTVDMHFNVKQKIQKTSLLKDLNKSIIELEKETKILDKESENLESNQRMNDISLKRENRKNSSKYNDEQKLKIERFIKCLQQSNNNLKGFNDVISKMKSGLLTKFESHEDIQFMELAGKIIAYSMDNKLLRADGVFAELKFYDMVKQEFHCGGDLIVKKDDVSTGLASANYLKQRIDNIDGDYVVVLLDEIGNMAQNAINTVIESIKKLEKQNRLVLAIFTRPKSDGIKIIEY